MSQTSTGLGRFGRVPDAVRRCGLSRSSLYNLASQHPGLFKKAGSATVVDLPMLDEIMADLPDADLSATARAVEQRRAG